MREKQEEQDELVEKEEVENFKKLILERRKKRDYDRSKKGDTNRGEDGDATTPPDSEQEDPEVSSPEEGHHSGYDPNQEEEKDDHGDEVLVTPDDGVVAAAASNPEVIAKQEVEDKASMSNPDTDVVVPDLLAPSVDGDKAVAHTVGAKKKKIFKQNCVYKLAWWTLWWSRMEREGVKEKHARQLEIERRKSSNLMSKYLGTLTCKPSTNTRGFEDLKKDVNPGNEARTCYSGLKRQQFNIDRTVESPSKTMHFDNNFMVQKSSINGTIEEPPSEQAV